MNKKASCRLVYYIASNNEVYVKRDFIFQQIIIVKTVETLSSYTVNTTAQKNGES